jgi:hypothetical protein
MIGANVLFMCIIPLINHLSVPFLVMHVQEIFGKHPENYGNLLSHTGFFPGNLRSQIGFYFSEIFLSDRLWPGERTTSHGNILRICLQWMVLV